ncbi:unnamed protein product, partial [Ectocarpus sp. 13 AM-2016]
MSQACPWSHACLAGSILRQGSRTHGHRYDTNGRLNWLIHPAARASFDTPRTSNVIKSNVFDTPSCSCSLRHDQINAVAAHAAASTDRPATEDPFREKSTDHH